MSCLRRSYPALRAPRVFNSPSRCLKRCFASRPLPTPASTPLAKQLAMAIKSHGPMTLAAFMKQCLTSPTGGYYTGTRDPFGSKGDFVTSPEISQMFGEMIGVWFVAEWMGQGYQEDGLQIIELGPGKGTLMDDVLRALKSFDTLNITIEGVYLIEASSSLREMQKNLLCGPGAVFTEAPDNGLRAISKYSNIPIIWYDWLSQVPRDTGSAPFILAHEFFDALPIHAFTATAHGWREFLVAHKPDQSPEFVLVQANAFTPHSILLPRLSDRYKALEQRQGSVIEISPEGLTTIEDIARRIGRTRAGAALIVDYGPLDTIPVNSLRGIKGHRKVSPFESPGETDVSADVDFTGLAERALEAHRRVEVHGPVEQGAFLLTMGMRERLEALMKGAADEEKRKRLEAGYIRLVERGGGGMGRIYKAMAVVPEGGGRRPVGFGGSVES